MPPHPPPKKNKALKTTPILYLETLKCIEMNLKLVQLCDDPTENPQTLCTPKNNHLLTPPPPNQILKFKLLNLQ